MTKKGVIIAGLIAIGATIAAVAAVIIGLNVVNNQAADQVSKELEQAIAQLPRETDLSYDSVKVQAALGRIEITGVQFEAGDHTFSADKIAASLPRSEALAIARNPEEAIITDVTIEVTGLSNSLANGETSGYHDTTMLQLQGSIPFELFVDTSEAAIADSDLVITYAALDVNGSSVTTEGYGELSLGSQTIEIKGNITAADLMKIQTTDDVTPLLGKIGSFSLDFSDLAMELTEEARRVQRIELESMLGPMPMLDDPENWGFESLGVNGGMTENGLELSQVAGKSNLVTFEGSFSTEISPELIPQPPMKLDLEVASFHDELRPILEILAWQTTLTDLPEGNSFEFSIFMADETSQPVITLE